MGIKGAQRVSVVFSKVSGDIGIIPGCFRNTLADVKEIQGRFRGFSRG